MKNVYSVALFMVALVASHTSTPVSAAPNCPPQYINICKQLIKALEDSNDGHHHYKWDGAHLIIENGNFAAYSKLNHSLTNDRTGPWLQSDYLEEWGYRDYFPHLLQQAVTASSGGQTVYIHLWSWGMNYATSGLSNAPLAPPTPLAQPQAVPSPAPQPKPAPQAVPTAIPNMIPQPMAQPQAVPSPAPQPKPAPQAVPTTIPNMIPQPMAQPLSSGSAPTHKPKSISITHNLKNQAGQPIDKLNVNRHFATASAGSLIEQEERAYLFDSNNDVWSCKVSGLGARQMPSANGATQVAGHVETLQFRSIHLAHIPGNHPMHSGCLISVEQ